MRPEDTDWFVYCGRRRFGPYSSRTLFELLLKRNIPAMASIRERIGAAERIDIGDAFERLSLAFFSPCEDRSQADCPDRRPILGRVLLHDRQQLVFATAQDISRNGMRVAADRADFKLGTEVYVNLKSPCLSRPFEARAWVARICARNGDHDGYWLFFATLGPSMERLLDGYLLGGNRGNVAIEAETVAG